MSFIFVTRYFLGLAQTRLFLIEYNNGNMFANLSIYYIQYIMLYC